ncbi:MAG TPA: hypothetical protein VLF40_01595 [Candidatus Saccharimonadales bacterium]|nr:hypothetical protein [Candidatus Saccharimonadales bacterium]
MRRREGDIRSRPTSNWRLFLILGPGLFGVALAGAGAGLEIAAQNPPHAANTGLTMETTHMGLDVAADKELGKGLLAAGVGLIALSEVALLSTLFEQRKQELAVEPRQAGTI